jgi:hypothetical protein
MGEPKPAIFNQKNLFRLPNDPTFLFARSAMMLKIARRLGQAIFVGGVGLEPHLKFNNFR